jgi:hypothetical protein
LTGPQPLPRPASRHGEGRHCCLDGLRQQRLELLGDGGIAIARRRLDPLGHCRQAHRAHRSRRALQAVCRLGQRRGGLRPAHRCDIRCRGLGEAGHEPRQPAAIVAEQAG